MTLLELTLGKVKDDSGRLSNPDDYVNAINAALTRYSKHRPLYLVADIDGDGGHDYALPADWAPGVSGIRNIEYPAGQVPEVLLEGHQYRLYQSPQGLKLRLTTTPAPGEVVRMTYTAVHTEDTAPVADLDAVANLAASICCTQLAAAFGQTTDSTIQADVVNYRSKTDEFRRLAEFLEGQYKEHLGIKAADTTGAAMATAAPPAERSTRLTHWGRR